MRIDILTLFPEIALAPLGESIIRRAQDAGLVEIRAHNLRDWRARRGWTQALDILERLFP